jgi:hypothetical protein
MIKNQRQAKQWSSRIREPQKPRSSKKAETDKRKSKEKYNTPSNFLNASSPPLVEFIMFSTNFSQPSG